jgi:hypothetical protein
MMRYATPSTSTTRVICVRLMAPPGGSAAEAHCAAQSIVTTGKRSLGISASWLRVLIADAARYRLAAGRIASRGARAAIVARAARGAVGVLVHAGLALTLCLALSLLSPGIRSDLRGKSSNSAMRARNTPRGSMRKSGTRAAAPEMIHSPYFGGADSAQVLFATSPFMFTAVFAAIAWKYCRVIAG